jgi:hypothetical protein
MLKYLNMNKDVRARKFISGYVVLVNCSHASKTNEKSEYVEYNDFQQTKYYHLLKSLKKCKSSIIKMAV